MSETAIRKIEEKVRQGCLFGFAEITLVIEKGRLRWIRGPAPSEAIEEPSP